MVYAIGHSVLSMQVVDGIKGIYGMLPKSIFVGQQAP
jgi:hypothetical protein